MRIRQRSIEAWREGEASNRLVRACEWRLVIGAAIGRGSRIVQRLVCRKMVAEDLHAIGDAHRKT